VEKYLNKIKEITIEKSGIDGEEVLDSSYFEDDLNIGEMELLDILGALEEEYEIEFTDKEKDTIKSVMELVELVMEKVE